MYTHKVHEFLIKKKDFNHEEWHKHWSQKLVNCNHSCMNYIPFMSITTNRKYGQQKSDVYCVSYIWGVAKKIKHTSTF